MIEFISQKEKQRTMKVKFQKYGKKMEYKRTKLYAKKNYRRRRQK